MRVAVILTARPSYAKLKPIIAALIERDVDVQVIACASALLERYGRVVAVARTDFPSIEITECWTTLEGANLQTSARETGILLMELASALARLKPDAVCVMADRHEVLAAAQAASYLHLPLIHCQGGERSGSIDDKVRDSISSLADYHCVATKCSAMRVYGLTGQLERITVTGCPSIDLAHQAQGEPPVTVEELGGAGAPIDLNKPFAVVLQHPVTSEVELAGDEMRATLVAATACLPTIAFWPGEDAGADAMSKAIREQQGQVHTVRSLPPSRFLRLLTQASVLIGNSSAGIREASYLGVPVVNIGSRQHGRERGPNVCDTDYAFDPAWIPQIIRHQIKHGRYPSSSLYGQGDAGPRIAEVIRNL